MKAVVLSRVRRVQRRLDAEVGIKAAVVPVWCAVTAAAAWRLVVQRHALAAGACFVAVAVVAWCFWVSGRRATFAQAAVIADRRAAAGGLLLTRLETPVGEWELELNQRVRAVTPPPIDVRRPWSLITLALIAGAAGFLVPLPPKTVLPVSSAAATRVEELAEKLETVAREEPTDGAIADELQRLREELEDGTFDAADWEAADTLSAALDRQAAEAQAELSRAEAAAKSLEDAMSQAQGREGNAREREELEQSLIALADGSTQSPEDALRQALGESGQQGQPGQPGQPGPSRSQVSDLRRVLQQRQQQLSQRYSPSQGQAGSRQASGQRQGQGNRPGQANWPGQGQGQGQGQAGENGEHASHGAEQGGAGHGAAPPQELVFGPQANIDPDRLKFEPLPRGHGGESDELFGLKAANPQKAGTPVTAGTACAASGTQARGNDEGALLPRNRQLIKRYFDPQ